MKIQHFLIVAALIISVPLSAQKKCKKSKKCKKTNTQTMELKNDLDSISYALGITFAANMKANNLETINIDALAKGIKDSISDDANIQMSYDEANAYVGSFLKTQADKKALLMKQEGIDFLNANKSKEGVIVLPSGMQYKILREGNGEKPTAQDNVTTHYHGTLIDGTIFDSSVDRGQPATFPVNGVIKGWTEALQLMPVGSKWRLFIPSDLAYGERGAGQAIKPHTTLIFDVELISIQK